MYERKSELQFRQIVLRVCSNQEHLEKSRNLLNLATNYKVTLLFAHSTKQFKHLIS